MQQILPINQIISRAAAIRLPRKVLVKEAGVPLSTILRAVEKGGCRSQTLEKLADVVVRHEIELQAHLNALHPKLAGSEVQE
jgi:hypothetical protein